MRRAATMAAAFAWSSQVAFAQSAESARHVQTALSWIRLEGAEGCPALKDVASRVDARLGRPAFVAPAAAELVIEAAITAITPQGWRVRITLSSGADRSPGFREILVGKPDCSEAVDTAALAIALMIDPNADGRTANAAFAIVEAPPPPTTRDTTPAPPRPRRSSDALSRPARPRAPGRTPWRTRLGLGPQLALGRLPDVAVGALGVVRLAPQSHSAGLDVTGSYLRGPGAEVRTNAGGRFSATSVGLCGWWAAWRRSSLTLSLGAGAQVGNLAARGFGFASDNRYAESWLLDVVLDLELSGKVAGDFGLLLRPSLGLPLSRDTFRATSEGTKLTIFQPSQLIGLLTMGATFEP